MKALLQRVQHASVSVDGAVIGEIDTGLLVFVCAEHDDSETTVQRMVDKIVKLRIFSDEQGKMNRSVVDAQGSILIVSQFTLAADTTKGNRPSYTDAANPVLAKRLYECFIDYAKTQVISVASGQFAADMQVSLVNDGPVTIPLSMA